MRKITMTVKTAEDLALYDYAFGQGNDPESDGVDIETNPDSLTVTYFFTPDSDAFDDFLAESVELFNNDEIASFSVSR